MKTQTIILVSLLTLGLSTPTIAAPAIKTTAPTALSSAEAADLLFMREEEKVARDVYLTSAAAWGVGTFNNIAASEQSHMDTIGKLVATYGLVDPVLPDIGRFTNVDLQSLYTELTAKSTTSATAALLIGGLIEEKDMYDIQVALDQTTHSDIAKAYDNLLCGSRNHLRSFAAAVTKTGVPYEAQLLSPDEVALILATPAERCGR